MADMLEGGCACGQVRYRLKARPIYVNCCHCRDCQRQTGGAFAINAVLEADAVEILQGSPLAVPVPTDSGRPHDIYRCPSCQVAVWSDYGRRGLRFVRVATLDDPAAAPPDANIYTRSKLPWVALDPALPAFEGFYDPKTQWPAEGLARVRAAMARAG